MADAKRRILVALALVLACSSVSSARPKRYTDSFMLETCNFLDQGTNNPYVNLTPRYRLVLVGHEQRRERGPLVELIITVLDETEVVDGVTTRVIEERESADGVLVEVSRNFVAICERNGSLVYFGEEVDIYDDTGTMVVSHEGAWRAGVAGARAGVLVPGIGFIGARYFQEVAPDVALDRAEVRSVDAVVETPAGTFTQCLETKETSQLERRSKSIKAYAPGVGLVRDDRLFLSSHGFVP